MATARDAGPFLPSFHYKYWPPFCKKNWQIFLPNMAFSNENSEFSMSDQFAEEIMEKLSKKTINSDRNDCILYTGRHDRYGYGVIDIKFPSSSRYRPMNVHRLRYMIHVKLTKLSPSQYHVSHLCNNKLCVNISHLSFEPPHINSSRQNCFSENRCLKCHHPHQDCLIN